MRAIMRRLGDGHYQITAGAMGIDLTHADEATAGFLAWALAYREHLWRDLCQCREAGLPGPAWHMLSPYAFVCDHCGGFLQKIDTSGAPVALPTPAEGEGA